MEIARRDLILSAAALSLTSSGWAAGRGDRPLGYAIVGLGAAAEQVTDEDRHHGQEARRGERDHPGEHHQRQREQRRVGHGYFAAPVEPELGAGEAGAEGAAVLICWMRARWACAVFAICESGASSLTLLPSAAALLASGGFLLR